MLNTVSLRNNCFFRKFRVVSDEINVIIFLFHLWRQIRFKDEMKDIRINLRIDIHQKSKLLQTN